MIKKEDLKKCQIVCRNQNQVKDCFNYLEQLGFKISYDNERNFRLIICYSDGLSAFTNYCTIASDKYVEFYDKEFVKTLQKFTKEKEKEKIKDIEVAEDGRITKINNWNENIDVFYYQINPICYEDVYFEKLDITATSLDKSYKAEFEELLKYGLLFNSEEEAKKYLFKLEIETKLKNIAERLNNGQKIDWEDEDQKKFLIYYDYINKRLGYDFYSYCKIQEVHCLDINFLDVAKKEIGEDNLIKYFKEYFN